MTTFTAVVRTDDALRKCDDDLARLVAQVHLGELPRSTFARVAAATLAFTGIVAAEHDPRLNLRRGLVSVVTLDWRTP